jgi:hypothetical protein
MAISAKLLELFNREVQQMPIDERRWPELAVELNQLREAAQAAGLVHEFDRDPTEFLTLLRSRRS